MPATSNVSARIFTALGWHCDLCGHIYDSDDANVVWRDRLACPEDGGTLRKIPYFVECNNEGGK